MTVLLFQKCFVAPIQAGTKRQTIRPPRKRPIPIGAALSLRYWSEKPYRSPQIEFATTVCAITLCVRIEREFISLSRCGVPWQGVRDLNAFARGDGFESWEEMREYFTSRFGYGLPFDGVLYGWEGPANG